MDSVPAGSQIPKTDEEEAKRTQEEQVRRDLMATVLDTASRERLSRISLVSPERAKQIEEIILRMARSGQLRGRISEDQLIGFLDQMEGTNSKGGSKQSTIVFQRKKGAFDDDDDFDV